MRDGPGFRQPGGVGDCEHEEGNAPRPFRSGEGPEATLHRHVPRYKPATAARRITRKTHLQAVKDWHKMGPELFRKQPCYLTGCDNKNSI